MHGRLTDSPKARRSDGGARPAGGGCTASAVPRSSLPTLYHCSVIRALVVLAAVLGVGVSLTGCSSTAPKATTGHRSHSPAAAKSPVVRVSSVTAVLEPKSPLSAKKVTPTERVNFTVSPVDGLLSCRVDVLRSGQVVGSTTVEVGSRAATLASVRESVAVQDVQGGPFPGTPADAHVVCHSL